MTGRWLFVSILMLGMVPSTSAQSAPSPTPPAQSGTPAPKLLEQGSPAAKPEPQRHLAEAQQGLETVAAIPLTQDAKEKEDAAKKLAQLRENFTKLMTVYQGRLDAHGHPAASGETPAQGTAGWKEQFSDVERALAAILGGGSSLSVTSTTAVGTNVGAAPDAAEPIPTANGTSASAPQGAGTAATNTQAPAGAAAPPAAAPDASNGANSAASNAAAGAGSNPAGVGAAPATQAAGNPNASGAGSGAVAGAAGATGTGAVGFGGVAVADIGVKNLDPRARLELERVRTSIELFYDAATRSGF